MPRQSGANVKKTVDDMYEEIVRSRKEMAEIHRSTLAAVEARYPGLSIEQVGPQLKNERMVFEHYEREIAHFKEAIAEATRIKSAAAVDERIENLERELNMLRYECESMEVPKTGADLDAEDQEILSELKDILRVGPHIGLALFEDQGLAKELYDKIKHQYSQILTKLTGWGEELVQIRQDVLSMVDTYLSDEFDERLTALLEPLRASHEKSKEDLEASEQSRAKAVADLSNLQEDFETFKEQANEATVLQQMVVDDIQSRNDAQEMEISNAAARLGDLTKSFQEAEDDAARHHAGVVAELSRKNEENEREVSRLRSQLDSLKMASKEEMDATKLHHAEIVAAAKRKEDEKDREVSELRSGYEALKESLAKTAEDAENAEVRHTAQAKAFGDKLIRQKEKLLVLQSSQRDLEAQLADKDEESRLRFDYIVWHLSTMQRVDSDFMSQTLIGEWKAITEAVEDATRHGAITDTVARRTSTVMIAGAAVPSHELDVGVAAYQLWLSTPTLDIPLALALFGSQNILPSQAIHLPWVHAALKHAVGSLILEEKLTPTLVKRASTIFQGFVYLENVARVWPRDHQWLPSSPELLKDLTIWLDSLDLTRAGLLRQMLQCVSSLLFQGEEVKSWISTSSLEAGTYLDSTCSDLDRGTILVADFCPDVFYIVQNTDTEGESVFVFDKKDVRAVEVSEGLAIRLLFPREIEIHDLQLRRGKATTNGSLAWTIEYLHSALRYDAGDRPQGAD